MSPDLTGRARWSHAAKCPRMAAMALLGFEPEEPSERQIGRMQRGKDAQRHYAKQKLEPKYGEAGVEHEPAVAWPAPPALPIGELHPDFYVPSEQMTIEVKSSEAVDSMFDISLRQAKGQVHWHPQAQLGALVFLDRDYQETDVFPVIVTGEDRVELDGIAAQVIEAGKTGDLPERVCTKPTEGIGRMCPFIRQCFEGWEPPTVAEREDIAPVVAEAYLAKRDLDQRKAELKPYEERYDEARAALDEAELPEGKTLAGQILANHILVRGSRRFSLSKAEKAGFPLDEEIYGSFISHSEGHSRWSFERIGEEPLAVDYGDDPPF